MKGYCFHLHVLPPLEVGLLLMLCPLDMPYGASRGHIRVPCEKGQEDGGGAGCRSHPTIESPKAAEKTLR